MALTDNLLAYYKMDDNVNDAHSVGPYHLTGTPSTGVAGKINNGGDYERAENDYSYRADGTPYDITGDLSVSCWINIETLPAEAAYDTSGTIGSKWSSTSNQRSYWFGYGANSGGTRALFFFNSDDGAASALGHLTVALSVSTWYHIVFVHDASAGTCEVYKDGSLLGTISSLKTSIYNSTTEFQLGACTQQGQYFDGIIDEVGIWDRTLTSGEVTSLYNSGSGLAYPFSGASGPANLSRRMRLGIG